MKTGPLLLNYFASKFIIPLEPCTIGVADRAQLERSRTCQGQKKKNVLIFLRGRSINANDVENLCIYIYVYACVGHTRTNTMSTLPTIRSIRHSSNQLHQTNRHAS